MSRHDIDKDLFDNIEIPGHMKRELYKNCIREKRTSDLRFRYAGALTALIIVSAVMLTGISAKAYYETWLKRAESMPETEKEELIEEINNDTGVTIDDAWSRPLTNDEVLRIAELEKDYYDKSVFPTGEVIRLDKLSDWDGKSLCYIEEDHLLHLPDAGMDDEQMLQFIDYNAKKEYLIENNNGTEVSDSSDDSDPSGANTASDAVLDPYVDVDSATEDDIIKLATKHLNYFLGYELSDEWTPHVEAFKPSAVDPDTSSIHDMYSIIWEKGSSTPSSTDYIVCLGMDDLHFEAAAIRGKEHWATLGSYTDEEAEIKGQKDKSKIYAWVSKMYGFPEKPDSEWTEVYHDYDDYGDARQYRYVLTYGDTEVDVLWALSTEELFSVEIFPTDY